MASLDGQASLIASDAAALVKDAAASLEHAGNLRKRSNALRAAAGDIRRRAEQARNRSARALRSNGRSALPTLEEARLNYGGGAPPERRHNAFRNFSPRRSACGAPRSTSPARRPEGRPHSLQPRQNCGGRSRSSRIGVVRRLCTHSRRVRASAPSIVGRIAPTACEKPTPQRREPSSRPPTPQTHVNDPDRDVLALLRDEQAAYTTGAPEKTR